MFAATNTAGFAHMMEGHPLLAIIAVCLGLLMASLSFKPFFDGWSGFWECVRFWFTPDLISLFRGEWADDQWNSMKLFLWLALSVGTTIGGFYLLLKLFHGAA